MLLIQEDATLKKEINDTFLLYANLAQTTKGPHFTTK